MQGAPEDEVNASDIIAFQGWQKFTYILLIWLQKKNSANDLQKHWEQFKQEMYHFAYRTIYRQFLETIGLAMEMQCLILWLPSTLSHKLQGANKYLEERFGNPNGDWKKRTLTTHIDHCCDVLQRYFDVRAIMRSDFHRTLRPVTAEHGSINKRHCQLRIFSTRLVLLLRSTMPSRFNDHRHLEES